MTVFTFKSKTHLLGAAMGTLGGLLTFLPTVREFIPQEMYGYIFMGVSVVTIILRNVTTTAISDK